jgi:hypothetical protein
VAAHPPICELGGRSFAEKAMTGAQDVSAGNGNGAPAGSTSGLIGLAQGSGNTTQIYLLSGNIFNPQASLFGNNTSNNTAATNISVLNGNGVASGIFASDAFSAINGSGHTRSPEHRETSPTRSSAFLVATPAGTPLW